MKIEEIDIKSVKTNEKNPRIIKDAKFKKLVKSIKQFPEMLEIRPIVVDDNMMVLGGNMRLKACESAGLKKVHIIKASSLTEEQKQDFIIKDNASYGEWNFDMLKEFDKNLLLDSGFEDWNIFDIYGDYELENKFTGNIEGSNFNPEIVNVDDYIKQNIFFLNEIMLEFEDDKVKEILRNIKDTKALQDDIKNLILKYGGNK